MDILANTLRTCLGEQHRHQGDKKETHGNIISHERKQEKHQGETHARTHTQINALSAAIVGPSAGSLLTVAEDDAAVWQNRTLRDRNANHGATAWAGFVREEHLGGNVFVPGERTQGTHA